LFVLQQVKKFIIEVAQKILTLQLKNIKDDKSFHLFDC